MMFWSREYQNWGAWQRSSLPRPPNPPFTIFFALPVSPLHMDEVDVARSVRMRSTTPQDIPPRTKPKQGASAKPVKNGADKVHMDYCCGICQSDRSIQVLLPLLFCLSFFCSLYSCLSFLSFPSSLFLSHSHISLRIVEFGIGTSNICVPDLGPGLTCTIVAGTDLY
jgi:hypothetical protein